MTDPKKFSFALEIDGVRHEGFRQVDPSTRVDATELEPLEGEVIPTSTLPHAPPGVTTLANAKTAEELERIAKLVGYLKPIRPELELLVVDPPYRNPFPFFRHVASIDRATGPDYSVIVAWTRGPEFKREELEQAGARLRSSFAGLVEAGQRLAEGLRSLAEAATEQGAWLRIPDPQLPRKLVFQRPLLATRLADPGIRRRLEMIAIIAALARPF